MNFSESLRRILDGAPEQEPATMPRRKKRAFKSRGPQSEEHRKKISEAMKGKKNKLGKLHSQESKEKMVISQMRRRREERSES
jgi:hypothetical protein